MPAKGHSSSWVLLSLNSHFHEILWSPRGYMHVLQLKIFAQWQVRQRFTLYGNNSARCSELHITNVPFHKSIKASFITVMCSWYGKSTKIEKAYSISFWCNQCCSRSLSEQFSVDAPAMSAYQMLLLYFKGLFFLQISFRSAVSVRWPKWLPGCQLVFLISILYHCHKLKEKKTRRKGGEKNPQKLDIQMGAVIKEDHWSGK